MQGDSLFIVPTVWARQGRLVTFLNACEKTIRGDTQVCLAIDAEEVREWAPFLAAHVTGGPDWLFAVSAPRMSLGPKMNYHAIRAAQNWPRVGFLADDTVPVTPGWDVKLKEALRTRGIAYARSNRRNDIPEHHLVSAAILDALGWYWLPGLRHYRADDVWANLGHAAGCLRYVHDAEIRHEHHETGAAPRDRVYRDAEERGAEDHATFARWLGSQQYVKDVLTVQRTVAGES